MFLQVRKKEREMICEVRPDHAESVYTIRCVKGENAMIAIDPDGSTWSLRFPDTCVCVFQAIL